MPKVIALVSKSKQLLISLLNEDSEFSMSEDRSTLIFQSTGKRTMSSVNLELTTEEELIQSFEFPCYSHGRKSSVRVDSIYPSVFGDSDPIHYVIIGDSDHLEYADRETVNLKVLLNFTGFLPLPVVTRINSVCLQLDSSTVVVASKEVLGATSDFFSNLFYGDFMEKNSGSYCIKEVEEKEFIWLINALMHRKWNVISVDQALTVLTLADRFLMQNVHRRIIPYLKDAKLDSNSQIRASTLKRYMDLATRCNDNGEFVRWIFKKCQEEEIYDVVQSCGSAFTPHLAAFCKFLGTKQSSEKKQNAETINRLIREKRELMEEKETLVSDNKALQEQREWHAEHFTCSQNTTDEVPTVEWGTGGYRRRRR